MSPNMYAIPIHPYRALFKLDGYPAIFGIRVTASISAWIDFTLIFIVLIGQFQATAFQLATASTLMWLPMLLLGPKAGSLADHYPAQRILFSALAIRGASVLLLLVAPTVELFLMAVLLRALGNLGTSPLPLAVRHIVPNALLSDSLRLSVSVEQGTRLVAPMVAGVVGFFPAPQQGFVLSAVLTLFSLPFPARLGRVMARFATPAPKAPTPTDNALSPWRVLMRSPQLSVTLWTSVVYCFAIGYLEPLIPILLTTVPEGAKSYGFVMGMTSAGALAGAHYAPRLHTRLGAAPLMRGCLIGTGVATAAASGIVLTGIGVSGWGIGIYWMLTGALYAVMLTCLELAIQIHAPTERIGAVSAKLQNTRLMALVAGPLLGGAAATYLGVGVGLACAAGFAVISAIVLKIWAARRDMN
ncbi:MAG: MFS transporter [Burkholderiaceae bacterium]